MTATARILAMPLQPPEGVGTGAKHRSHTIAFVRRMHAGGWNPEEIYRYLNRHGVTIAQSTVYDWTNEDYAERRRTRDRERKRRKLKRRGGRLGLPQHTAELKAERLAGLRTAGLSFGAIARAMNFDYPDDGPLDEHRVRYLLTRQEAA